MKILTTAALALLAVSCASEFAPSYTSSREPPECDGSTSSCQNEQLVPVGGSCTQSSQCEPTAWTGVIDPDVFCYERVCTFDCVDDPKVAAKCSELGGTCELAGCQFGGK